MLTRRIIPCLDVAKGRVVKGVNFIELRDAGDPAELAERYSDEGADEIVFLDIAATHEARNPLVDVVEKTARRVFVPLTVGGGIDSVAKARELLHAGADKVSVNSAAVRRPELIAELSENFGAQAVVLAIDAKAIKASGDDLSLELAEPKAVVAGFTRHPSSWRVHLNGGRVPMDLEAVAWAIEGAKRGAGEILLTSMDADGVRLGFDIELTKAVSAAVNVPVIASGGAGSPDHFVNVFSEAGAEAALAASIFHYEHCSIASVKSALAAVGIPVRLT